MKNIIARIMIVAIAVTSSGFCATGSWTFEQVQEKKPRMAAAILRNEKSKVGVKQEHAAGEMQRVARGFLSRQAEKKKKPAPAEKAKPVGKTAWWNRIVQTVGDHPIWWKSGAGLLGVTAIVAGVTGGMARHYNNIPDSKLDKAIKNRFVRMLVKIGRKGGVKYKARTRAAAAA